MLGKPEDTQTDANRHEQNEHHDKRVGVGAGKGRDQVQKLPIPGVTIVLVRFEQFHSFLLCVDRDLPLDWSPCASQREPRMAPASQTASRATRVIKNSMA